jgi:regulatory protein
MVPGRDHPPAADPSGSTEAGGGPRRRGAGGRGMGSGRRGAGAAGDGKPRGTARDRALNLLSFRDRSRRELERRLLQAGFEPEDVVEALAALERAGLVDDERFARSVVEQEAGRRLSGRRAVASALVAKGVDRDAARAALAELDDPSAERGRADDLARARATRLAGLPPEVAYRRLAGLLARRGYSPWVSRDAARRALGIGEADDSP